MNGFMTPLIIGVAVAAVTTLAIWLFHVYTVSACRKELAAYKQQVVSLSDKIDAVKERHRLLPQEDQDFTVPMSGETLAAYNEIAARLEHHRQVWLKLMDVWEQVQALLDSEWFFGNSRARTARRNLRAAAAPAAFSAVLGDCEAPLDRIEKAHAQAASDLKSYREEDQQLGSQLDAVAAAALAIAPYQPERQAAAALVERAQGHLPADPLATLRCLDEARHKVAAVRQRAAAILVHAGTAREMTRKVADIQLTATQRRSQGFLLQEEGSNPDPLLGEILQQHVAIQEALNLANETVAGTLLAKASAVLEQARQGLEQHIAAKARCETEIPARQAEARRHADAQALARAQSAELARDFAPETWLGVADNVQRAQASLNAADQYVADAAGKASVGIQHYVQASKLLAQAADNHQHAHAELTAVGTRLRELVELRAKFQAQIGQLGSRSDQVNGLLQSSTADRALANERYRTVRSALEGLLQESRQSRPDWTRLTSRLSGIGTDLDRVEQLAKEDMQLAQQAAAEIAETEKVIRDARAFRDGGFSADVSAAESQLSQARGCLTAQGYEEAIRLANAAEQMARFAHQEAIGRAQRQQQELESRRRAEEAAAMPCSMMQAEAEPS